MRISWSCVWFVCAGAVCAQASVAPELVRARAEMERTMALVEAGAAPRLELERAEAQLRDAEDASFLRTTLYGGDLTEAQADDMIAVANRRLERRREALARAKQLVEEGVLPPLGLTSYVEEFDRSRKEVDLAESRARLTRELAEMARLELEAERQMEEQPHDTYAAMEKFTGDGAFSISQLQLISLQFEARFSRPLPVSALGETAVHRAMGFDHRHRVDVALHPDQPEGLWLRQYLTSQRIPFFAFRRAVPGKSTGSHIHIGPSSTRIQRGG